jgi:hypothetical protein
MFMTLNKVTPIRELKRARLLKNCRISGFVQYVVPQVNVCRGGLRLQGAGSSLQIALLKRERHITNVFAFNSGFLC